MFIFAILTFMSHYISRLKLCTVRNVEKIVLEAKVDTGI